MPTILVGYPAGKIGSCQAFFLKKIWLITKIWYNKEYNDKKTNQNSDTIDIHHVTFNGNKYNDVIIDSKSGSGAGARG